MKFRELLADMQKLAEERPETLDYEVAQQDCFSSPYAFTGTNVYVGHYYETEVGGYLNKEDADESGNEVEADFPAVVIESF